jgi:hypothetical protein
MGLNRSAAAMDLQQIAVRLRAGEILTKDELNVCLERFVKIHAGRWSPCDYYFAAIPNTEAPLFGFVRCVEWHESREPSASLDSDLLSILDSRFSEVEPGVIVFRGTRVSAVEIIKGLGFREHPPIARRFYREAIAS